MKQLMKNSENQIFTYPIIQAEINSLVAEVQRLFETERFNAEMLLQKFKWSIESIKISHGYLTDKREFLISFGIIPRVTYPMSSVCSICYIDEGYLIGLECGHSACIDCWRPYLKSEMEKVLSAINCFDTYCPKQIKRNTIEMVDSSLIPEYEKLLVKSYVKEAPNLEFCPGFNCDKIIQLNPYLNICSCGFQFCISCKKRHHTPATCHQIELWEKAGVMVEKRALKENLDKKSYKWVSKNTKECPNCYTAIEKNSGCNHMTCQYENCRFEFCWKCCEPWQGHQDSFICRSYRRSYKSKTPQNTQRLFSYYENFKKQENLLHQESELLQKVVRSSEKWAEPMKIQLKEAMQLVSKCRCALMHSLVFEFYLSHSKELKTNRSELESSTEKLAKSLMESTSIVDLALYELKMTAEIREAEHQLRVFLDYYIDSSLRNSIPELVKSSTDGRRCYWILIFIAIIIVICIILGLACFLFWL